MNKFVLAIFTIITFFVILYTGSILIPIVFYLLWQGLWWSIKTGAILLYIAIFTVLYYCFFGKSR